METKSNFLERNYYAGAIQSNGGLMIFLSTWKSFKRCQEIPTSVKRNGADPYLYFEELCE